MVDALKKKQTVTSTALRLGTFRLFFSGSFFPYSWNRQWNLRHEQPFGNTRPWSDQNSLSGWIFALCEYKHYPFFYCGSSRKVLMKRNTSSLVGFVVVALYNTSNVPFITAAATKISRPYSTQLAGKLPSTKVKFPAASNRMKVLGLRWASNVTSANSQASFRNKGQ